jgi:ADP-heptose:LPS heptosyltransferase
VIEPLADAFSPAHCDTYARLFSQLAAALDPSLDAAALLARYQRVRRPRRADLRGIEDIYVLSRVTLGADVAVTSVVLDAARRACPSARLHLVGSRKAWELFRSPGHVPVEYGRAATLRERIAVWPRLREALSAPAALVLDPDSRLTQLGLLPVSDEQRYHFFESRSYGAAGTESLVELTRRWCRETLGIEDAAPWIDPAPVAAALEPPYIAMSLGVGENPAKRLPDPFEDDLFAALLATGARIAIDKGAPGEEMQRVERLLARHAPARGRILAWQGAFAPFASLITRASFYVGYDSAGQHVAAAAGTPLAAIFRGFAGERTLARWRPTGRGPVTVLRADLEAPTAVIDGVLAALR